MTTFRVVNITTNEYPLRREKFRSVDSGSMRATIFFGLNSIQQLHENLCFMMLDEFLAVWTTSSSIPRCRVQGKFLLHLRGEAKFPSLVVWRELRWNLLSLTSPVISSPLRRQAWRRLIRAWNMLTVTDSDALTTIIINHRMIASY